MTAGVTVHGSNLLVPRDSLEALAMYIHTQAYLMYVSSHCLSDTDPFYTNK